MNLHICLVSAQILPNYIPILMDKPDQVHLVSTAQMQAMTTRFQKMLEARGIAVVVHPNMPDSFLTEIHEYALELQGKITGLVPDAVITLNITGGNKLMMLGILEIFRPDVQRIIYTDTANDVIECLHDRTQEPLASVLDVRQYLLAYGAVYRRSVSDDAAWFIRVGQRKAATKYLATHGRELAGLFGALNALASQALSEDGTQLLLPKQQLQNHPSGSWRKGLHELAQVGVIEWDSSVGFIFKDAEAARYIGGIWLEEYVFHIARDSGADDVCSGVEITWEGSKNSRNELDVLIVHHNRMLVIECKTLRLGRDEQKDADILYKIDSLGDDVRGLFGETWLVSAREPVFFKVVVAKIMLPPSLFPVLVCRG